MSLAGRCLAGVFVVLMLSQHAPAAEKATVTVEDWETYGRVILDFPDLNILPKHTIRSSNGVLVIEFAAEAPLDISRIPITLARYITIARADPDDRGARFALARGVRVNTMEAGAKLFLDFLPSGWSGPPPRLPDDVVAELARRAEEAALQAKEAALLRQVGDTKVRLDLRVGRTPTFSRFVFAWNVPFEATLKRTDGVLAVAFNRNAPVDLSPIRADLPPFVDDIEIDTEVPDGLGFRILVAPDADVRAFREADTYVVDIEGKVGTKNDDAVRRLLGAARGDAGGTDANSKDLIRYKGSIPDASGSEQAGSVAEPVAPPTVPPASQDHASAEPHAAPTEHAAADPHGEAASPDPHAATGEHAAPAEHAAADPHAEPVEHAAADPHSDPAQPAADAEAPKPAAPLAHGNPGEMAEVPEGRSVDLTDAVLRVEAKRIGRATRLVFPYKAEIGSAMFTRGGTLWLLFDDPAPLGVESLQNALAGIASVIEPITVGEARGLRITLVEPLLATLNPDGTFWVVTIGDMVTQPIRPLQIKRQIRDNGAVSLEVPFGPVNGIHRVMDPTVGDEIVVVTALGPPRGLTKPQSFVDVDALSSGHGLAIVPKVDDVSVLARETTVVIDRPDGMAVSTAVPVERASLLDLPSAMGVLSTERQAFMDLGAVDTSDPRKFWERRHELHAAAAQAQTKDEKVKVWYEFAEFNLANSLGYEAGGVLDYISALAPEEATSSRMGIMRAAAAVLSSRYKDVLTYLEGPEFADHPEAAIWKSIALTELGDYPAARRSFPRAEVAVGRYPVAIQNKFLIAGIKASIELNDYGKARSLMAQLEPKTLSPNELASIDILNARAADATGHSTDAMELLSKAVQNARGPVEAEATYRLVNLQRREGLITPDQAADRLEQLAISWRGDDVELRTLRTLGQLSVERGDFRRGFELMRVANVVDSQAETTRLMQEEMQSAFASLFLDGKADDLKPVDALALYYDFRELTPPGKRGDEMVRNLASKLVDVDLLPQAAQLLSYQVDNRLRGASKAKVAADLALVYLLDKRPEQALMTLGRTRQAELPVDIERQRRLVEVRALADTGKYDLALELLKPLAGSDVDRLRAEVLWGADRHQESGEQFERLLGGRWAEDLALDEREQHDVLRAGVAYALAQDEVSLDRLRNKFGGKMSGTKSASAFDVVTGPIDGTGAEFNQVAQQIVASDSVTAFLAEYRKRYLTSGRAGAAYLVEQKRPEEEVPVEVPGTAPDGPVDAAHGPDAQHGDPQAPEGEHGTAPAPDAGHGGAAGHSAPSALADPAGDGQAAQAG